MSKVLKQVTCFVKSMSIAQESHSLGFPYIHKVFSSHEKRFYMKNKF